MRKAVIVASDYYEHEGLQGLGSPQADAAALARVLGDPQIGDFQVSVVQNEPAYEVQAQIEDLFAESRPDDVLLLHFACHGLKSDSGELYFAARNTRLNRLASTAISADFVQRCMRSSRSRSIVLLLDCCYGGAFSQGVAVRGAGAVDVLDSFPGGLEGGRGRAVITASTSMEYAFEGDRLADDHSQRTSVFTRALVKGLTTGDADRNEDGWISLNELYDYVFDQVRAQNPNQTPTRDIEMQGELYLARSRRRRIKAMPLPPDLEAATQDPNMFARLGAISELRSRLTGTNLPAAAGAYDRLADMARNDIQFVAEAATSALKDVELRISEQALRFGPVAQSSHPAAQAVRLLGPPLAQACSYQPSAAWIRLTETTDGVEVSVDTSEAGRHQGFLNVKGSTGEASILVEVEVTPEAASASTIPHPAEAPAQQLTTANAVLPEPVEADPSRAPTRMAEPKLGTPVPAASPAASEAVASPQPDKPPERLLRWAALLALAGALLTIASLTMRFAEGDLLGNLYDVSGDLLAIALFVESLLIGAAAALTLAPRTRLCWGPGLLIGVVAGTTWGLLLLAIPTPGADYNAGYVLALLAHLILLVCLVVTVLALRHTTEVRLRRRPQAGRLGWAVLLLAAGGALALFLQAVIQPDDVWGNAVTFWAAALALVLPTCAAMTVPLRFAVALLTGWIAEAVILASLYIAHVERLDSQGYTTDSGGPGTFLFTVICLAVVTAFLARKARRAATRAVGPPAEA